MLALANDVMMCTNRKTCWWNGGNVLETFLKASRRLQLLNVVVITLDDETHSFCNSQGGAPCMRMELPVPSAQQGSRGANMISTLKYGLLRQALLMGFAILVVGEIECGCRHREFRTPNGWISWHKRLGRFC